MLQPLIKPHNRHFTAGLMLLGGLILLQKACAGTNPGGALRIIFLNQDGGQFSAQITINR